MTDLRSSQVVRETLDGSVANLNVAGVVREGLLTDANATILHVAGTVRESLLLDPNINNLRIAGVARETLLADAPDLMNISYLECVQYQLSNDHFISVRFSDDAGASWSNAQVQSLGDIGQYNTSVQFRRPFPIARNGIVELSWSGDRETAVSGIWIDPTLSGT